MWVTVYQAWQAGYGDSLPVTQILHAYIYNTYICYPFKIECIYVSRALGQKTWVTGNVLSKQAWQATLSVTQDVTQLLKVGNVSKEKENKMRARLEFPDSLNALSKEELLYVLHNIQWTKEDKERIEKALRERETDVIKERIEKVNKEIEEYWKIYKSMDPEANKNKRMEVKQLIDMAQQRKKRYKARLDNMMKGEKE